jgi:hypothetical protein
MKHNVIVHIYLFMPYITLLATVAERSKACTVFARSEAVIVGSNPTQGMGYSFRELTQFSAFRIYFACH